MRRFGRPPLGLHALQLEVSRGVYMDEQRCRLYAAPDAGAGTQARDDRETPDGPLPHRLDALIGPHRAPIAVGPRRGRRLAELRHRIDALVASLTGDGLDEPLGAAMPPPHATP